MQCLMQKVCFAKEECNVDAKSMLCEGRMQCLMQKGCFAKEECNVRCNVFGALGGSFGDEFREQAGGHGTA